MNHLLSILFAAVLTLGAAVSIQATEPDRIVQSLSINDVQPYDEPLVVETGTITVRLRTSLTCYPPPDKVGCGVVVAAILHSPVVDPYDPETYPLFPDVLDQTSQMLCRGVPAIGCQQEGPDGEFVYTFSVPKPGRYTLKTSSKVGFDYFSPDIRLTTDHPVLVGNEIYEGVGVVYEITGFANIDVVEAGTE